MDLAFVSRVLGIITTPSNFLVALLILGTVLLWARRRGLGKGLVLTVSIAFLLIYFLPVDDWVSAPLENRYSRPAAPARVDGAIILGGGESGAIFAARGVPGYSPAEGRLVSGAELARHYPNAKIVYSGGWAPFERGEMPEASVARAIFAEMDVPPSRLILENRSRNTWENFVYSKTLARPRPGETWLLVTSAAHMPRAMGIAAKLHWHVLPWPSDYRTTGKPGGTDWNSTIADRLDKIDMAAHEWIGLIAYRLMGRLADGG